MNGIEGHRGRFGKITALALLNGTDIAVPNGETNKVTHGKEEVEQWQMELAGREVGSGIVKVKVQLKRRDNIIAGRTDLIQ